MRKLFASSRNFSRKFTSTIACVHVLLQLSTPTSIQIFTMATASRSAHTDGKEYYRADGVRITHDPYAPGMAEKYGKPGAVDSEGFDPYRDTVGPGIYGGIVKRSKTGQVVIGRQYQNHNPRPGPVYAGGGYTPITQALKNIESLKTLLGKYPDLVNDISTGGAMPLHMCGMSRSGQMATETIIAHGGDIEALDTYGMTPLHRMASNNLPVGAAALLRCGSDPTFTGNVGATPMDIARSSNARDVMKVLREHGDERIRVSMSRIQIFDAGVPEVVGIYERKENSEIPHGFDLVCQQQGWETGQMWKKLSGGDAWFGAENGAYIYHNKSDGKWWIDAPSGNGVYIAKGPAHAMPAAGWSSLVQNNKDPVVSVTRACDCQQSCSSARK